MTPFQFSKRSILVLIGILFLGIGAFLVATNSFSNKDILVRTEDVYRADRAGGATPEETITLFAQALEKRDVHLASSYFEIQAKADTEKMLSAGVSNGGLKKFAEILKGKRSIAHINPDTAQVSFLMNGKVVTVFELYLNSYSHVWKIGRF